MNELRLVPRKGKYDVDPWGTKQANATRTNPPDPEGPVFHVPIQVVFDTLKLYWNDHITDKKNRMIDVRVEFNR